jgi:NarL family two-component system response regulator LiaR
MTGSGCIRVIVVDDHTVVRSGIKFSLLAFKDIELVGEASGGEEAVHLCGQLDPDVVLMDMMMPGMDGVAATQRILENCPQVRVLALTSFQEGDLVREALQAGAIGYLLKDVEIDELARAIRSAYAGRSTMAEAAAQALAKSTVQSFDLGQDLTNRQLEVLALVVEGLSNVEIADRLAVSLSTVRFHVSTVLSKLGANNRAEAAALAVKYRLLG